MSLCMSRKKLKLGFRVIATCGLLISIISLCRKVGWHTEETQVSDYWNFELEICFSIYGFFLASTSYYLGEIQANSWARFHIGVSVTGILMDIIVLGYHANLYSLLKVARDNGNTTMGFQESPYIPNSENDHFMIPVAVCQMANNSIAILLCRQLLCRTGVHFTEDTFELKNSTEESSTSLLRSPRSTRYDSDRKS